MSGWQVRRLSSYSWSRLLTGPNGATILASNVRVFAEVMHNVTMASGPDGATGPWPDALIPDVDDVVSDRGNYYVVRKRAGEPARVAEEDAPR